MNECLKLGSGERNANVRFWVWPETVGQGAFAQCQTLGLQIGASESSHLLRAFFPTPYPKYQSFCIDIHDKKQVHCA